MSALEIVAAVSLITGAALIFTKSLDALFPSRAARLAKLDALLRRAAEAEAREDWDAAEAHCRHGVRLAQRWFGRGTKHATEAWYALLTVGLRSARDELAGEAARRVVDCAAEHPGLEEYAARGREELARARARLGAVDEARALLDQADAIRREHLPDTLAQNLEMRARVAFLSDDLPGTTRIFESLLAAVDGTDPAEGPYRSRAAAPDEPMELAPEYVEEVLSSHARVLYLRNLDSEAERVLARLIARTQEAMTIGGRAPSARLHAAARRLASHGLMDGPRALALAGAELAAPASALEMKIDAARWAWRAGDWRGADEILQSLVAAGWDAAGRAELLGELAFQRYSYGAHEVGEKLFHEARSAHASFAPSLALTEARASSTFATGDREGAAAIIEASLVPSAAEIAWTVAGTWAMDRSIHSMVERSLAKLRTHAQRPPHEALSRAILLSTVAARRGELEQAERALAEVSLPVSLRALRALLDHHRGWLMWVRGRHREAFTLLGRAWGLRASTMDARGSLATWVGMAAVGAPGELATDPRVRAIAAGLPERDSARAGWLMHEARLQLHADDPEGALATCDQAGSLDAHWYAGEGAFAGGLAALRSTVLHRLGSLRDAEEEARRALALRLADHPADHPLVAAAERHLAGFVGEPERRALLERALAVRRAHQADDVADIERDLADPSARSS